MKGKFKNAGTHIILIIASFISVFPLYWMIAAATNNSTDVLGGKLSLGTNFIQNLMKLTEMQNVSRAFCNSLFYSTILSVLSLFICSIAGYGFEIYHDKAKDTLMNILLLAMMVPFADYEIHLCCSTYRNFHECMEQLPLAESYHDVRYITDDADVSGKSFRGLQY